MLTKRQTESKIAELLGKIVETLNQSEDWRSLPKDARGLNIYIADNAYFVYQLDPDDGPNVFDIFTVLKNDA